MDSVLFLERAENELKLAKIVFAVSQDFPLQTKLFDEKYPETYYSATITHCYYCIFYCAKAYLINKGVKLVAPQEHKKAYVALMKYAKTGELDLELLKLYQEALVRAETLLGIFHDEKKKRGDFTYKTLPQANQMPARESIANAQTFYKNLRAIVQKQQ